MPERSAVPPPVTEPGGDARGAGLQRRLVALGPTSACPGCGVVLPRHEGPRHAYVGASAACWELYRRLSTPPFVRRTGTRARRLAEDAYAAQHPGVRARRSLQSIAVHLMGLCVLLERDGEDRRLTPVLGRMPPRPTLDLHWLTPPETIGRLTARDALAAGPDDGHEPAVEAWAADVWAAWAPHHATIRAWLDSPCLRTG